jgi:hypothetical protein
MSEWRTVDDLPPMLGELDETGRESSGPLLVYVADRDEIVFGECRMMSVGPRFKARGFTGDWKITHWMPLPPPPSL